MYSLFLFGGKMSKIENLNFYIVEDGYIEYASRWDHHIAYNKNNKRPYVGIVFKINGFSYFSPIKKFASQTFA